MTDEGLCLPGVCQRNATAWRLARSLGRLSDAVDDAAGFASMACRWGRLGGWGAVDDVAAEVAGA